MIHLKYVHVEFAYHVWGKYCAGEGIVGLVMERGSSELF